MSKSAIIFDILIAFIVIIVGFVVLSTVLHNDFVSLSRDISDMLPAGISNAIRGFSK